MKNTKSLFIALIVSLSLIPAHAHEPDSIANKTVMGTFINPVIYADVPDMAMTRAGDDFYMISTTMHLMPGAPIMKSKDLVNWETVNYVFDKLTDHSRYDLID